MLILLLIIVGAEIVDVSINKIYLFMSSTQFPLEWNTLAFISLAIVYVVGQYVILKYVRKSSKDIRSIENFSIIHNIVTVIQYALIVVLLIAILQISITSHYSIRLLLISIWISYVLAIFMLGFMARRFFYWFKSNKNIVVLFYGLSTMFIAADVGISLVLTTSLLIGQPIDVHQIVGSESPAVPDNILQLEYAFIVVSIASFILTWIATVLMLRHHARKLGMIKYWVIVSIPLVYFLTQFQPLFLYIFSSYMLTDPISFSIIYTIIFSASKPVGGLLFAAAFWSIARRMRSRQLRNYMIISAYGLALIFGSEQALILANRPYPPFGLATISFLGLASYLVLVGIYSSAISVSMDSKLRESIRNFATKESRLLDSIGTAQMEREIEKRVIELTKRNQDLMVEETGISSSLTEEDVKKYLEEVIKEVSKDREQQR
jgi:hypothetical protein